jgi:shikimate dehydrogenase
MAKIVAPKSARPRIPDRYGVVGYPVANSRLPLLHGLYARATGQEFEYRLHDVAPADFRRQVEAFFAAGGCGLNVIAPHKAAAATLAQELSARASRAGAVNVLTRRGERVFGDNTDGAGLLRDLTRNLGLPLAGQRVLILGAGAAAAGITGPLLQAEPAELRVANRNPERARKLAAAFHDLGEVEGCGLADIPLRPFDLVINATTAARQAGGLPGVSPALIGEHTTCYDLSYGGGGTPFTRWALQQGCARVSTGWGMLVEQAADTFELWRGLRPDTQQALQVVPLR